MGDAQILDAKWQIAGKYTGITCSGDGKLIAASLGTGLQILNAGTGAVIASLPNPLVPTASLAFSHDSNWVAAVLLGNSGRFTRVEIRDAGTLQTLRCSFEPFGVANTFDGSMLTDLAFSPDGASVLCATIYQFFPLNPILPRQQGGEISAFDAATGSTRWTQQAQYIGTFSPPAVFSPTGQSVAYATPDHNGVLIVDAMTGTPVFTGPSQVTIPTSAAVNTLAYSPDGRWLIAGCADSSVHVFDTVVGASPPNAKWPITLPGGGTDGITSAAVSGDSHWIAAINSNFFGIYALPDATLRFTAPAQLNLPSRQLTYSPTLRHVIPTLRRAINQGSQTSIPLAVIDAFTGGIVATGATDKLIHGAALAADGTSISCIADGSVELLGLDTVLAAGVELAHYPNAANPIPYAADTALTGVAVSPLDAPPLVAIADTSAAVRVVNAQTGAFVAGPKPAQGVITAVTFARQGQAVVTAASSGLHLSSIAAGGSADWGQDTIGAVNALALIAGPAGESVAVAVDRAAQLRSTAAGEVVWSTSHPQTVTRIAGSADGKFVATGCLDRIARILEAATGATIFTGPTGGGKVTAVLFPPTGTLLAWANEDGTVHLVNAATLTQNGQLSRNSPCRLLAFVGDATLLGVADETNTVTVYDITDLTAPAPLPHPLSFTSPITALAFSPADSSLAVATGDTTVALHDPRTGNAIQRIVHPQPVRQFAFNTTGSYLATICDDQTTRTWRMVFE